MKASTSVVKTAAKCRYFSLPSGCRFGAKCHYSHQQEAKSEENVLSGSNDVEQVEVQATQLCEDNDRPPKDKTESDDTKNREGGKKLMPKGKIKTVCRYFSKGGYCREGEKCRFLHLRHLSRSSKGNPAKAEEQPAKKEEMSKQPADSKVDHSKASNVQGGRTAVSKPGITRINIDERLSQLSERSMKYLQKIEIGQLNKRFARNDLQITKQDSQTICEIKIKPSDPEWPYDVKVIQLTVVFPSDYPRKIFEAEIINDGTFPENFSQYVNRAIGKYLQEYEAAQQLRDTADLLFRPFLRWLDRNLESLFTRALKQIKCDIEAKSAGFEFIPSETRDGDDDDDDDDDDERNVETTNSSYNEVQKIDVETSEVEVNKETIESVAETKGENIDGHIDIIETEETSVLFEMIESRKASNSKKGTQVRFRGLELHENTATVHVTSLTFTVQCCRCKNREEIVDVKENKQVAVMCSKCSNVQAIVLNCSEIVHQYSATVAYINPKGCLPLDLILSECQILLGCLNCSKETSIKGINYGSTKNVWCHHCHQKLDLKVDSARFHRLQPVDNTLSDNSLLITTIKANAKNKDPPIKIGQPLPENGTCKHYKKSYRWMRFPCCGKCYPCDKCHEENEGHEIEQANRMICGFCSKEQSFTQKGCTACKSFVTAAHTSHWEGGKGCRSKIKMSRGDDKKYSDRTKTVSKHATKVENQKRKK